MNIYFQGALLGETDLNIGQPPVHAIFFRDDSSTGRNEQLVGSINALRISTVSRSPEEIAAV